MITFVDTSAVLAYLDAGDARHKRADAGWHALLDSGAPLLTTNSVLSETFALVQARLGIEAVEAFDRKMTSAIDVIWVEESLHRAAVIALLAARRRGLSLVDCVSFEAMRRMGITRAFAFDRHFEQHGFESVA